MNANQITTLARHTLETTMWLGAPVLIVAIIVGVVVSVLQVMTAIQDMSLSTIPRLLAVALTTMATMPWLLRKLSYFTLQLFSDFHPYVR
jgi:flagellar biosynthesis protein FliQ